MTLTSPNKKCPYSPHLGPVGCLSAPNIFPLAKETFAKGKMFWNSFKIEFDSGPINQLLLFVSKLSRWATPNSVRSFKNTRFQSVILNKAYADPRLR